MAADDPPASDEDDGGPSTLADPDQSLRSELDELSPRRRRGAPDLGGAGGGAAPPPPPSGGTGGGGSEPEPDPPRRLETFNSLGPALVETTAFNRLADVEMMPRGELHLVGSYLEEIDAHGAVTMWALIRRFLAHDADNGVQIWEPADESVRVRLWNFLASSLPEAARWCEDHAHPGRRDPSVMVPTLLCEDDEFLIFLEDEGLPRVAAAGGVTPQIAARLRAAFADLADNARRYGSGRPVIALALDALTERISFAMWDDGPGLRISDDPVAELHRSLFGEGPELSLHSLPTTVGGAGWLVTADVASGVARARFDGGAWSVYGEAQDVPGFAVGFTLIPLR